MNVSTTVRDYGEEEENSANGLIVLGVILSLLLAQMVSHSLDVYQITFVHMSGIHILIGLWLGLLFVLFGPKSYDVLHNNFPEQMFFEALLPPIIFAAGFDLNRSYFFQNIRIVLCMGLVGTIINFFVIGTLFIWGQNTYMIEPANSSGQLTHAECLQFAAILSATDAICVVTLIDSEAVPHVFNVLASEGVINDAVAIILYASVSSLEESNTIYALTGEQIGDILLKVIEMSVLSGLYGIIVGAVVSFYFKHLRTTGDSAMEGLVLFLFSYISYQIAELLDASGIISVFFTGFMISKYTKWSLSEEGRESIHILVHFCSESSEKLIFVLLGLYTFSYSSSWNWSITLIAFTLLAIILGRAVLVVVTTNITNLFTPKKARMGWSEQLIFVWGGLVRGAIAFALSVAHSSEHKDVITTATLIVVITSTLLVGSLSSIVLSSLPIRNPGVKRSTFFESNNAVADWFREKDRKILQKLIGGKSAPRQESQERSFSSNMVSGASRFRGTTKVPGEATNSTELPISCLKKSIWDEKYHKSSIYKHGASKGQRSYAEIKKTMSRRDPYLRPLVLDIPHGLSEDEWAEQKDDSKVSRKSLEDSKEQHSSRKTSFDVTTDQSNSAQNEQF